MEWETQGVREGRVSARGGGGGGGEPGRARGTLQPPVNASKAVRLPGDGAGRGAGGSLRPCGGCAGAERRELTAPLVVLKAAGGAAGEEGGP